MDRIPFARDAARYGVDRLQIEGVRQSLYDFRIQDFEFFQTTLTFFQQSIGAGFSTAQSVLFIGSTKTIHDTNLKIGGAMPSDQAFLVESIELLMLNSSNFATQFINRPAYDFATTPNDGVPLSMTNANVLNQLLSNGALEFIVGDKSYLTEAPLSRFPPKTYVGVDAALSTNDDVTAPGALGICAFRAEGRPYYLDPPIFLRPNQPFKVNLKWPNIGGGNLFIARIGVILDGYLYRHVQ